MKKTVAAFDFDGTISFHDTLIHFLLHCAGFWKTAFFLSLELPTVISFLMGKISRQRAKESILSRFFSGKKNVEVKKLGQDFANGKLNKQIRSEAFDRIAWHKKQGHQLVLISASLDVYLEPWGKKMGFNEIITSRLEESEQGIVSGKLVGLNCWGPEKIRRLEEVFGKKDYELYAYGDSRGDKELLEYADYPYHGKLS